MKKIIARISGGLGNQLFTYASIRRLALNNKAKLILDDKSGFSFKNDYGRIYQLNHFNIPCRKIRKFEMFKTFPRIYRYLKRNLNLLYKFDKRNYIFQENDNFDPRLLNLKVNGTLYAEGLWQSENYFKDFEKQIRKDLSIKPPKDYMNKQMAKRIKKLNSIAIHIRFYDDLKFINKKLYKLYVVKKKYYEIAINKIKKHIPNAHYFIFTDRSLKNFRDLPLNKKNTTIVNINKSGSDLDYADLWLMSQCKHFIIGNSSFSWWGAWLAKNKNKIVFAPNLKSLKKREIPKSWILI
jgi:hypothetical protein